MINLLKLSNLYYNLRENLKGSLSLIFSYRYIQVYFVILVLSNVAAWITAYYIKRTINLPQIALHYSVDFGIDLYDNASRIYIIPLLGVIIIVVNYLIILFLGKFKQSETKFICHLLSATALVAHIMLFVALVSIYLVNFR